MTPDEDPAGSEPNPLIFTEAERDALPRGYDAGDPRQVKKFLTDAKERERRIAELYREVFSTIVGRRAMWDILATARAFETRFSHAGGVANDPASFFDAGRQALGFDLYLSWLKIDPDGVQQMLLENEPRLAVADEDRPKRRRPRKSPLTRG